MERTYLFVPFNEKEEAKALGARFDAQRKAWYVPDHLDLSSFKRWVEPPRALTEQEIHDQFTQALEAAGLVVSGIVQMDGRWHKTTVSTSRNTKALKGAYRCEMGDGAALGLSRTMIPASVVRGFQKGRCYPARSLSIIANCSMKIAANVNRTSTRPMRTWQCTSEKNGKL